MNKYKDMNYRELKVELDYHTKIFWKNQDLQLTIWNAGLSEDSEAMLHAKHTGQIASDNISLIKEVMYSGLPK